MDSFNKQFLKVVREIEDLASEVEYNENVKEYLIEAGDWNEDYKAEFNIVALLDKFFMN